MTLAIPEASVTAVFTPPANVADAPLCDGAVNVTVTFGTGLFPASFTTTCSAGENAELIAATLGLVLVAVTLAAGDGLFVNMNVAALAPVVDAVTVYGPPATLLAVADILATPELFVTAVFTPPVKVTDAPLCDGAVNVTVTPAIALPLLSLTVASSGAPNAVLMLALWPDPPVAATTLGLPAAFVRVNPTDTLPAVAVTV